MGSGSHDGQHMPTAGLAGRTRRPWGHTTGKHGAGVHSTAPSCGKDSQKGNSLRWLSFYSSLIFVSQACKAESFTNRQHIFLPFIVRPIWPKRWSLNLISRAIDTFTQKGKKRPRLKLVFRIKGHCDCEQAAVCCQLDPTSTSSSMKTKEKKSQIKMLIVPSYPAITFINADLAATRHPLTFPVKSAVHFTVVLAALLFLRQTNKQKLKQSS